jgi:hypothetical protein
LDILSGRREDHWLIAAWAVNRGCGWGPFVPWLP